MDVLTVREVMRYATNWCRSGKGPIIVELDIHRLFGHSMIHPDTGFNSQGELEAAQHYHDPIIHFGRFMTENGLATHDEIKVYLLFLTLLYFIQHMMAVPILVFSDSG